VVELEATHPVRGPLYPRGLGKNIMVNGNYYNIKDMSYYFLDQRNWREVKGGLGWFSPRRTVAIHPG
jgi:hypothetical protein